MAKVHTSKEAYLAAYEREHATTMRVLRAYPTDKLDLRPDPKLKNARELAWMFVLERGLGKAVFSDVFGSGRQPGQMPPAPDSWDLILGALEKAHEEFGELVRLTSDKELEENVKFFVGPGQLGDYRRIDFAWFLLHDQIHHRGQFSVYLRMAGGKVPSIYGPSHDEPWT
jgi:uncharacterized damage-inducible protein DinB